MSDCIDADGFRANVGIILSNDHGQLLLAGRARQRGWQFPQGGINPGENPTQAMYRELAEEVGLCAAQVRLLGTTQPWLRYRLPKRYWRRNSYPLCIGQKQIWFLLQLACEDGSVCLDSTDHPEFDRWRWVDFWEPVREVIYFKKRVYARALEQLGPLLFPDGMPPRPKVEQQGKGQGHHRRRRSRNRSQRKSAEAATGTSSAPVVDGSLDAPPAGSR
jgi:putative (di)nucleoside polyphosphate hydrolase